MNKLQWTTQSIETLKITDWTSIWCIPSLTWILLGVLTVPTQEFLHQCFLHQWFLLQGSLQVPVPVVPAPVVPSTEVLAPVVSTPVTLAPAVPTCSCQHLFWTRLNTSSCTCSYRSQWTSHSELFNLVGIYTTNGSTGFEVELNCFTVPAFCTHVPG